MQIALSFSPNYHPSLLRLEGTEIKRVVKAVEKFGRNSDSPGLNLHAVESDSKNRLFTIRASDELRVLLIRIGDGKWIVEEAGHHDPIYNRAATGQFVVGFQGMEFGFHSALDAQKTEPNLLAVARNTRKSPGLVLSHWSDAELVKAGLSSADVVAIRGCATVEDLLYLDIDERSIELAIDLLETSPELLWSETPSGESRDCESSEAVKPLVEAVEKYSSAWGFSDFYTGEELAKILSAPIESWMIFLHPKQRELVGRVYAGPARIGGGAGTGKTVVALHRAAFLAQKFQGSATTPQILFTTYIRSLPPYFERLYRKLPNAIPGAVRFLHVDGLAAEICRAHGLPQRVDIEKAEELFQKAYQGSVTEGSPLGKIALGSDYVLEEINAVVRGRMLRSVDEYLIIERTGRKTPLQANARRQLWKIYQKYQALKADARVVDFIDVVELAVQLTAREIATYRSAIIDEAQDLSLLSLQLVRNLVNGPSGKDKEDGLLLVGDGAQRIYPSCFTLAQAGIQVRGRSTILGTNYRNTKEILKAAFAVAGEREIDDLGSVVTTPSRVSSALPPGPKPRLVTTADNEERMQYVVSRIMELVRENHYEYGDISVLADSNFLANGFAYGLAQAGVPTLTMREDRSLSAADVRVGTFHRAKGLEFKAVFLLGLEKFPRGRKRGETESTFEDRYDLELNVLFVAMTRAREHLEIVVKGAPSEAVTLAGKEFRKTKFRK